MYRKGFIFNNFQKKLRLMKKIYYLFIFLCLSSVYAQDATFTTQSVSGGSNSIIGSVDLNGDFLDDILVPSESNLRILYQTTTGFDQVDIPISVSNGPNWSISVGDYDANGINDIMYGGGSGVSFLKANADGTSFTQEDQSSLFIFSQRTNFIDINNDGHLDAFVCHDVQPNVYFLNDGNGNFLDEIQGGLGDTATGHNYGSLWFDYDNDGDNDLYLSKCVAGSGNVNDPGRRNQLHRNNGDGTYTEVGAAAGIDTNTQSWSSAIGDFDNDGDMDIISADQHFNEIGTIFYENNGDGTFTDITSGTGFDNQDGAIDIVTFDFNNDGYLDIYSGLDTSLLINNGDNTFSANTVQIPQDGSVGDLNNDGFLDVFKGNIVYMNNGNNNNWLKINLEGEESNINGIGAKITIEGGFGIQVRNVRSGEGFWNMHTLNPHFGLGDATSIDVLTIEWPSGIVDSIENITVNQTVFVKEGNTTLGLGDNENSIDLTLFPSPAASAIRINTPNNTLQTTANIIDITGKIINTPIINNTIDVKALSTGIYFLQLETTDNQKIVRKFTKK